MRFLPHALFTALALVLVSTVALAINGSNKPQMLSDSDAYERVGTPIWGSNITTATSDKPVTDDDSTGGTGFTTIRTFQWGSSVRVSCEVDTTLCWSQTSTLTMATTGAITDANGPDGRGACVKAEAGIPIDFNLTKAVFADPDNSIGVRAGVCANSNKTYAGIACRVDGDCPSSGTCSTTAYVNGVYVRDRQRGAYLMHVAGSASTCFITEFR